MNQATTEKRLKKVVDRVNEGRIVGGKGKEIFPSEIKDCRRKPLIILAP